MKVKLKSNVILTCSVMSVIIMGCTIVNEQIAKGNGSSAEEAVQRITDDRSLENVSLYGQNEKARVLAVKKLNNIERLFQFVGDFFHTPPSVREAALDRLIELGIAEKIIANKLKRDVKYSEKYRNGLYHALIRPDGPSDLERRLNGMPIRGNTSKVNFPEEWRIRAFQTWDGIGYLHEINEVALDKTEPIKIRIAAIKRARFSNNEFAKILKDAANKDNPARIDNENLVRAYCSSRESASDISNILGNKMFPLESRKLAFSCLQKEDDIIDAFWNIASTMKESQVNGSPQEGDGIKLARYALEKTKPKTIERFFNSLKVNRRYGMDTLVPFMIEASKRISDEAFLVSITEWLDGKFSVDEFARVVAKRIKNPKFKKNRDALLAKNGKDIKECVDAFVSLYSVDPARAYEVISIWQIKDKVRGSGWDDDKQEYKYITAVEDVNILAGLIKLNKNGRSEEQRRYLKVGFLNRLKLHLMALPQEERNQVVEVAMNRAQDISKSGNVCVIGNYYLKMPVLHFIALSTTQDSKAVPMDWEWDEESKQVIMTEIAFDTKNLYKATGLEKTEVKFRLPSKLGMPNFEVGMTKIQYNRNYFAESMGSYDFNTVSGGDIYYRSESQKKNVVLLLWEKSGQLVMSQPE